MTAVAALPSQTARVWSRVCGECRRAFLCDVRATEIYNSDLRRAHQSAEAAHIAGTDRADWRGNELADKVAKKALEFWGR
eukprot:936380-Amphidinium_carterae.2